MVYYQQTLIVIPRTKQRISESDRGRHGTGGPKANNMNYVNRDVNSILAFFN